MHAPSGTLTALITLTTTCPPLAAMEAERQTESNPAITHPLSPLFTNPSCADVSKYIASYVAADLYPCAPIWSFTHSPQTLLEPVPMPALFTPDEHELITSRYNEKKQQYEIAIFQIPSGKLATKDIHYRSPGDDQYYAVCGIPYQVGHSNKGSFLFVLSNDSTEQILTIFSRTNLTEQPAHTPEAFPLGEEPCSLESLQQKFTKKPESFQQELRVYLARLAYWSKDLQGQDHTANIIPGGTYHAQADERKLRLFFGCERTLNKLLQSNPLQLTLMDLFRLQQLLVFARAGKKNCSAAEKLRTLLPEQLKTAVSAVLDKNSPQPLISTVKSILRRPVELIDRPDNRIDHAKLRSKARTVYGCAAIPLTAHGIYYGLIQGAVPLGTYSPLLLSLALYAQKSVGPDLPMWGNRTELGYGCIKACIYIVMYARLLYTLLNLWE